MNRRHHSNDVHWTVSIGKGQHCANCGLVREGKFCPQCGQKHLSHRLQFAELLKDLLSRLSNLDRGLLHTFIALIKRPGGVARDYVCGKQRAYVNPLAYFFFGAALQLVSVWFSAPIIRAQMAAAVPPAGEVPPAQAEAMQNMAKTLGGDPAVVIADIYITSIQQAYTYVALIGFCFPLAVLLKWLHRRAGEQFELGEVTVFSLYMVAQMLVLTAFVMPIAMRLNFLLATLAGPLVYAYVMWRGHSGFFRSGLKSRLLSFLALFISCGIFATSILGVFAISFAAYAALARLSAG